MRNTPTQRHPVLTLVFVESTHDHPTIEATARSENDILELVLAFETVRQRCILCTLFYYIICYGL